jgi:hypothetical protein
MDGEGRRLITGAPDKHGSAGSAYIFSRSGTNWSQADKLVASDSASGDKFGSAVSISDSGRVAPNGGQLALVGAETDDIGLNTDQGSAYVFGTPRALPVELAGFEATPVGSEGEESVALTWKTATETNNDRFRVERSTAAGAAAFQQVTSVESKAGGDGTSSSQLRYAFTDDALPFEAQRLTYRLTQIDRDGSEEVVAEQTVEVGGAATFTLKGSAPNPFRGQTTIRYELAEQSEVTLEVFDARGRQVRTLVSDETQPSGGQSVTFDAEGLSSGVYFYRLRAGDFSATRRAVLVR